MTRMSYPAREGTTRNVGAPESSHRLGRLLAGLIDHRGGDTAAQERIRDLVLEAYAEYEQRAASA